MLVDTKFYVNMEHIRMSIHFHPFLLEQQVLQIHDELLRPVVLLSKECAVKVHMLQDCLQILQIYGYQRHITPTYSDLHTSFANNQHPSP